LFYTGAPQNGFIYLCTFVSSLEEPAFTAPAVETSKNTDIKIQPLEGLLLSFYLIQKTGYIMNSEIKAARMFQTLGNLHRIIPHPARKKERRNRLRFC